MPNLKRPNIQAIIFDCDGTLVDSEPAHLLCWQKVMERYGYHLSEEEHAQYAGKADTVLAEHFAKRLIEASGPSLDFVLSKEKIEHLLFEKNAHYRFCISQGAPAIEATVDFVHQLALEKKRLNLKLAVASAALKQHVLIHLDNLGLLDYFEVILSGSDDLADYSDPEGVNKPKPYIYLHAARLLGVPPEACVAIEDSFTGVSSARQAGCLTLAIPNTYTKHHDLSQAHLKIDTLQGMSPDRFLEMMAAISTVKESLSVEG